MDTQLLVSEKVVEGLDEFLTRPLGRFLLAGRASFLRVAELMGCKQDASSDQTWLAEIFADALLAYESQDWPRHATTSRKFAHIRIGPARFILKRRQHFREAAPTAPWDGCIRVEGK